jgi:hypothetical protein
MFYSSTDGQYIQEGTQFTINSVTYPSGWLNQSTAEQKAELGLEEVVATNSPFNPTYYWTGETLNGATLTYTGIPKDLTDIQKQAVAQVNQTAYAILLPSDWMASKAFETSTPINPAWNTWRASIRTTAADTIALINSAIDVDNIANVMDNISWANDPNAPIPANLMGN